MLISISTDPKLPARRRRGRWTLDIGRSTFDCLVLKKVDSFF